MRKNLHSFVLIPMLAIGLSFGGLGCNWTRSGGDSPASQEDQRQRDEKTRDEVARETERLKPAIQDAGRKLNDAAEKAAEEARAAAKGVQDGWTRGGHTQLDVNSASEKELTELPGITGPQARRIMRARPYADKRELVSKGILPRSSYKEIEDQITAK
jgi:DNA uptake protein ComE-like DNA-binding protein